jgi:GT2 family glycosyltransferase/glycosyltransferase involved in cell wall biosynthesis/SAM-dependent methyltransferase
MFWWLITLQLGRQLRARRTCGLISRSGLFDRDFYLKQNPDVAASGLDPVRHYFLTGAREGRNPHPIFASAWYLKQNADVASLDCNPLEHFILHGRKEGRLPSPLFDPGFYRQQVEPTLRASLDPLAHFLEIGRPSGLSSHPLFDSRWYLKQNQDVALAGVDALSHYLSQGWKEGRDPSPLFRTSWYLQKTRDAKVDPLTHYLVYGWHSGISPHPLFDSSFYLERNTDVLTAGLEPLTHYVTNGAQEGRDPHPLFDSDWYVNQNPGNLEISRNPLIHFLQDGCRAGLKPHRLFETEWYLDENKDIAVGGINPLEHYLQYGGFEGRDPHPLFDSDWYLNKNPDVIEAGINPLAHYLRHGWREARNPHEYFDVSYYLSNHPGLAGANAEPLNHFLSTDPAEAGNPHPQFDAAWYLRQYGDVASSGINPLVHYVRWGRKEGRSTRSVSNIDSTGRVEHGRHKIVFISGESHTPGHLYRVTNLATALAPKFFDAVVVKIEEIRQVLKEIAAAEILWIWRAPWSEDLAMGVDLAGRRGAKIVFDTDDLMFRPELAQEEVIDGIRSQELPTSTVEDHFRRIRSTLIRADHCTSPTRALTLQIRRLNRPASVIPNGFDRGTIELARSIRKRGNGVNDSLIRIGYASGSRTHQRDLAVASRAIAAILRENADVRLVLFRNTVDLAEFPEFYAIENQIEWRNLVSVENLPSEYARFDINIAPLEVGNEFCESKSELKYFEAALVNVPTVASPTEPFSHAIRNGENGFLAGSDEEWYTHLNCLVNDPALRSRLAQKAYSEVIWTYGPERRSLLITNLVHQLLSDSPVRAQLFAFDLARNNVDAIPPVSVPECDVIFQASRKGMSRVTIIVPLFNYGHFLPDALESVRSQTVSGLDVIVIDDRSTDDSLRIAKAWLERHASEFNSVVLLQNRKNSKLGATRNAGIAFSDTELFLPLDPDNLLLPDCVEKCLKQLDETGAAFAYPTMDVFGDNTERTGNTLGAIEFDPTLFNSCNYIDAMALVRKACWTAVGGYSTLDPAGWEDYEFWCKLVEKGFYGVRIGEIVAKYRAHSGSMLGAMTDRNKKLIVEEIIARHPWLGLPPPEDVETQPAEQPRSFPARKKSLSFEKVEQLESLVSILQCPETGEDLRIADQETLISMSGRKIWPVVNGRPVFTSEGRKVFIHPDTHISNPLPEEAIRIIKQTQGRVLNLSAGGSKINYRNVVELEYSIFRNTDIIGDVHRLPFHEGVFDAVLCLNAFEHYREPDVAMTEIRRVLRPGGQFFLHTAFLQPLHEAPHHYYNCTEFGLRHWLKDFNVEYIRVSDNFNPVYAISWLASEIESAFISSLSPSSARDFREARMHEFAMFWRDPETRKSSLWELFYRLAPEVQHRFAAGFEGLAKK